MTDRDIAIKVDNVSKTFRIPREKISSLRGAFVNLPALLRGKAMQAGASEMQERRYLCGIINKVATLDKFPVFAIIMSAKTTRYDPLGMAGFCLLKNG